MKTYVAQVLIAFGARDRTELASRAFARARELTRMLVEKIDQPLVVSDEMGAISFMNTIAARLGLCATALPPDLCREIRLRHRRHGIGSLRGTFRSSGARGAQQWTIEDAAVDGQTAMLLWCVTPIERTPPAAP